MKTPQYYRVTPVFGPQPNQLMTAAIQTCMATGTTLSGIGGGGLALSKDIVDALDMHKHGGESRMVCSTRDFEDLVGLAERLSSSGEGPLATEASEVLSRITRS